VRTFMVLTKRIPHPIDSAIELYSWELRRCFAVDHFSGSNYQSFFVPLVARTVLPIHATNVAKLCTTFTTVLEVSELYR